jgi:hypothetical protein
VTAAYLVYRVINFECRPMTATYLVYCVINNEYRPMTALSRVVMNNKCRPMTDYRNRSDVMNAIVSLSSS